MSKILCLLGFHKWQVYQEGLMVTSGRHDVVMAWKLCMHCCKTKRIHILK
jgi:hypothetical protein